MFESILAVDIGNYSTQSAVISHRGVSPVNTIRSISFNCTNRKEARDNADNDENPVIELGDTVYLLGQRAGLYKSHFSAAQEGKAKPEVVVPLLLSSLREDFRGTVKMLVPQRNTSEESLLRNEIVKKHYFTRNGKSLRADIKEVEFYEETKAAAEYAYKVGSVAPYDTIFCLDIGGGTLNYGIFSYEDDLFTCLCHKSNADSGGIELAKAICSTDLVKGFSWTTDISRVMSAISQGKRIIGNRTELDFSPVYEECVTSWFRSLLVQAKSHVSSFFPEVTKIVWVGGGAEIVRERIEKIAGDISIVLDNPQNANISHLIHESKLSCMS